MTPGVVYTFGPFRLDPAERVLSEGGRVLPLTPKAFDTLLVLVGRHGHLVTKDELFRAVWPDAFVEENNLAQYISTLRRVLGDGPDGPYIETVTKRGYRFRGVVVEEVADTGSPENGPAMRTAIATPAETHEAPAPRPVASPSARGVRSWGPAAGLTLLVTLAAGLLMREAPPDAADATTADGRTSLTRIAVLPFSDVGAPGNEAFVAGITEEIASRLAALQQLAITSTTTVAAYDRRGKAVADIGAALRVQYLVEGSVRWAATGEVARVRITPRLVRVADDTTVWTQQYDAALGDLVADVGLHGEQIATALQVALDSREREALAARPTRDTDAYLAFLSGLAYAQQGISDTASNAAAREAMERAVARDPRFALAWSWLARVLSWQYRNGSARSEATREEAERAARTALDLAPGMPEAHLSIAEILFRDRQYDAARREIEVARAGLPNSAEVWRLLGQIAERGGQWRESRAAYLRGFNLDPHSLADPLAVHYLHMRQYDESRRYAGVGRAANRSSVIVPDAWGRFSESGDIPAARAILETALQSRAQADGRVLAFLARLEWFDGRYDRALALISRMDPAGSWLAPNFRFPAAIAAGQVYESLGRPADATRQFEEALRGLESRTPTVYDYQVEAAKALALAGLDRRADAYRHAERAMALLPMATDAAEGMLYVYVLAQVQARVGDHAAALATLDGLFEKPGFYNEHWVAREPWFAGVRALPAYAAASRRWSTLRGDVLLQRH